MDGWTISTDRVYVDDLGLRMSHPRTTNASSTTRRILSQMNALRERVRSRARGRKKQGSASDLVPRQQRWQKKGCIWTTWISLTCHEEKGSPGSCDMGDNGQGHRSGHDEEVCRPFARVRVRVRVMYLVCSHSAMWYVPFSPFFGVGFFLSSRWLTHHCLRVGLEILRHRFQVLQNSVCGWIYTKNI